MKYLSGIAIVLALGWLIGCTAAASQQNLARAEETPSLVQATVNPAAKPSLPAMPSPTSSPIVTQIPLTPSPTSVKATDTPLPSPSPTSPPPTATPTSATIDNTVKEGLQLYQEQNCGNCHRLDVARTHGTLGPMHNHIATVAEERIHAPDYTGTATTPAEYLRESIVNPGIYLVAEYDLPRQKMPAFTNLSEAEVEALVRFLLQQK